MNKKIDVILAKELSRLARNGELSYQIKNLCENHGVHIITLDGAINTLQGNTHMFGLYAWMYEQEAQRTSERVKETLKTRAKKGLFKGSTPPYGYTIKDGKLHIRDDETPNIVRRIFNEYLAGYGRDSIARRLYNEGIPTPAEVAGKKNAGDKWNDSTIKLILTNPHYTGDLVQGRTTTVSVTSTKRKKASDEELIIIPNAHEPIIPRDVFEAVQHQMKLRSKTIPAQNGTYLRILPIALIAAKACGIAQIVKVMCAVDMPDSAKKLAAAMSSKRKCLNKPSFMTSSLSCSKLIRNII